MSITKNGRAPSRAEAPSPSVSALPAGLAAKNVPRSTHSSCHRSSICWASSAVYRNGTSWPPAVAGAEAGSGWVLAGDVTGEVYRRAEPPSDRRRRASGGAPPRCPAQHDPRDDQADHGQPRPDPGRRDVAEPARDHEPPDP